MRVRKQLILLVLLFMMLIPVTAQEAPENEMIWDGTSRFTILIMGLDKRPDDPTGFLYRSDAIMIASLDPIGRQIGILSIPRDMHLVMQGNGGLIRVNSLLVRGEQQAEGTGPALAIETIGRNLSMQIDAYVLFDFQAFVTLIDSIGGVDIDINYFIRDPEYPDMHGGFDPFYLRAGEHHLDGETALKFARTRHGDTDFLRVQRQLQVVGAIRDRLRDPLIWQKLLGEADSLFEDLSENVFTNIPPEQMLSLGFTVLAIPAENIHTGALNQQYSYSNGTARVPDYAQLSELMSAVFGENYGG